MKRRKEKEKTRIPGWRIEPASRCLETATEISGSREVIGCAATPRRVKKRKRGHKAKHTNTKRRPAKQTQSNPRPKARTRASTSKQTHQDELDGFQDRSGHEFVLLPLASFATRFCFSFAATAFPLSLTSSTRRPAEAQKLAQDSRKTQVGAAAKGSGDKAVGVGLDSVSVKTAVCLCPSPFPPILSSPSSLSSCPC